MREFGLIIAGCVVLVAVVGALIVSGTLVARALDRGRHTCVGHGGVQHIASDATDGHFPVVCRDGFVFTLRAR